MKYPGEVYTPSAREYGPPEVRNIRSATGLPGSAQCGRICIGRRKISLSNVFAGQYVGIREIADQIWLVRQPARTRALYDYLNQSVMRAGPAQM